MTAGMKVAVVEPGSVILLTGVVLGEPELMTDALETIAEAVGHTQFVLIQAEEGADVEVWGPDVDLKAKVEQLLADVHG
jgi:hypothetical protein